MQSRTRKVVTCFLFGSCVVSLATLLGEAGWPVLDDVVMQLPAGFRQRAAKSVVSGIFSYGYTDRNRGIKTANRTLRLDPKSGTAWLYMGDINEGERPCVAQRDFENAEQFMRESEPTGLQSAYLERSIGESALTCGNLPRAKEALSSSQHLFEKVSRDGQDITGEVLVSHYLLSIYWDRSGNHPMALKECLIGNPTYQTECSCSITSGGTSCQGR